MLARPPHRGETSATIWGVGSRPVSPPPPEHRVMSHTWSCPPPRAITKRRTRCQSDGRNSPSPKSGHPSSHTPIRAERSTPNNSALPLDRDETIRPRDGARSRPLRQRPLNRETLNDRPTLTTRVVKRARKRNAIAETHFRSDLSRWMGWYVAGLCHTVSHNVNTMLLQRAPNLLNLLLIHTTNANATVNLTVTVLNNFELKRDTVQPENYFPAQ